MNALHTQPLYREEWIIDARQKDDWAKLLQDHEIDPEFFPTFWLLINWSAVKTKIPNIKWQYEAIAKLPATVKPPF